MEHIVSTFKKVKVLRYSSSSPYNSGNTHSNSSTPTETSKSKPKYPRVKKISCNSDIELKEQSEGLVGTYIELACQIDAL